MAEPLALPRSLTSHVLDLLRDVVLSGRIAPGTRLNEVEIAAEIGVSRGPVREAIRCLVSEGLLVSVPNRGAYVLLPDRRYIIALFELRIALETAGARLAASRAEETEIDQLKEMCARSRSEWRAGKRQPYQLDLEFHRALMRLAQSPLIASQVWLAQQQVIVSRNSLTALHDSAVPTHHLESFAAHEQIVEALATRDEAGVGRLMELHVERIRDQLLTELVDSQQRWAPGLFNSMLPSQWHTGTRDEEKQ